MPNLLPSITAGFGLSRLSFVDFESFMKTLFGLLLLAIAGCAYDPITPAKKPHAPRPSPYGVTNQPAASIDQFRVAQLSPSPQLLQTAPGRSQEATLARHMSSAGWEFVTIAPESLDRLKQVPFVKTNNTILWTATPGHYRVIVSDNNTDWQARSFTCQFRLTNTVSIAVPTNKYFRLVSP